MSTVVALAARRPDRRRYRREEPADLMLLLVSRLFDLGTGRGLEGGAA